MGKKEDAHRYYLRHREAIIAKGIAYYNAHKEALKEYYKINRDKYLERSLRSYYHNKAKVLAYQKQYKRQHVIRYHDSSKDIYGLNKPPYPTNGCCTYCGRKNHLTFHHGDNPNPNDGIWLCMRCHMVLERTFRYPKLGELIKARQ